MSQAQPIATWKGSTTTARMVASEIASRWGDEEAKNYDPLKNCFTYRTWKAKGYQVQRGEKAIKSITFVPSDPDDPDSDVYPKTVNLFYIKQVKEVK